MASIPVEGIEADKRGDILKMLQDILYVPMTIKEGAFELGYTDVLRIIYHCLDYKIKAARGEVAAALLRVKINDDVVRIAKDAGISTDMVRKFMREECIIALNNESEK